MNEDNHISHKWLLVVAVVVVVIIINIIGMK